MKRFIAAILCVGLIAAALAGCAYKDALSKENTATQATEATSSATKDEPKAADFKDNLQGLTDYFTKLGYLTLKDEKLDERIHHHKGRKN